MVCKIIFFVPKFPDILEELWNRRRWRKEANVKHFAFQANTKTGYMYENLKHSNKVLDPKIKYLHFQTGTTSTFP